MKSSENPGRVAGLLYLLLGFAVVRLGQKHRDPRTALPFRHLQRSLHGDRRDLRYACAIPTL
jgi:hypothetical protein